MPLFLTFFLLALSSAVFADMQLPIHSLRDQGMTSHCWAYASSHMLESRRLDRDSVDSIVNVEKDVLYWVDYERLLYVFHSKKFFDVGGSEGGWQVEYWEALLKHGRVIYASKTSYPDVWYSPLQHYDKHLPFMPEARPKADPQLMPIADAIKKLQTEIKTEAEAVAFITDYLNREYGQPLMTTSWFNQSINISDTAKLMMGTDWAANHDVDSLVLVKPVQDGHFGWVKYLYDRYWGYRYNDHFILKLVEKSLDNRWPVTFDNVTHAMTIIGYVRVKGDTYYAVADSVPGEISWYDSSQMKNNLNLVTFFRSAIPKELPERGKTTLAKLPRFINIDKYDHVDTPPR